MNNIYNFKPAGELPEINFLPPLLLNKDGEKIKTAGEWLENRDYLKAILKYYMYGDIPEGDFNVTGEVVKSEEIYDGKAISETVKIEFGLTERVILIAEIIRPNKPGKFRVITCIAFPNRFNREMGEEIIKRNYAVALFNYEQLFPDKITDETPAIYKIFNKNLELKAIAMWAFCNMRLIDYLDMTDYAIKDSYITAGHSRNGKAALCAGIFDERVKITVSNNSGCGGCGCFRFLGDRSGLNQDVNKVESLERITKVFPYWFSENLNQFYDKPGAEYSEKQALNNRLPFDLHFNRALIAPRALLSLEAGGDEWANTYGSKLTHDAAKEVFDLLGVPENIEIKFREGKHEFNVQDWFKMLDFCDLHK